MLPGLPGLVGPPLAAGLRAQHSALRLPHPAVGHTGAELPLPPLGADFPVSPLSSLWHKTLLTLGAPSPHPSTVPRNPARLSTICFPPPPPHQMRYGSHLLELCEPPNNPPRHTPCTQPLRPPNSLSSSPAGPGVGGKPGSSGLLPGLETEWPGERMRSPSVAPSEAAARFTWALPEGP